MNTQIKAPKIEPVQKSPKVSPFPINIERKYCPKCHTLQEFSVCTFEPCNRK